MNETTRGKLLGIIAFIIILCIGRYLYLEITINLSSTGGIVGSYSIEQSRDYGVFIKKVKPFPKEIYYNENYNIYFEEAWLENVYTYKNSILWRSIKPLPDGLFLNVKYYFRDKKTKQLITTIDSDITLRYKKGEYTGNKGDNILFIDVGNLEKIYNFDIHNYVDNKIYGKVTFK